MILRYFILPVVLQAQSILQFGQSLVSNKHRDQMKNNEKTGIQLCLRRMQSHQCFTLNVINLASVSSQCLLGREERIVLAEK